MRPGRDVRAAHDPTHPPGSDLSEKTPATPPAGVFSLSPPQDRAPSTAPQEGTCGPRAPRHALRVTSPLAAPTRPLLVTEDAVLLDDLLRLAALAGTEVDVTTGPPGHRPGWLAAPLVLLGSDAAVRCVRAGLPRRPGVVLVGGDPDDPSVWQTGVSLGAEHVVFLPDGEPWLVDRLAEAVEPDRSLAPVVGVVGGRGGAGATSLAVALACAAVDAGQAAWLVDGDPLGGGIDLALGGEHALGARWPDVAQARGRLPAAALTEAVPLLHGVRVLSCARPGEELPVDAVAPVLGAARRSADLVVVDLPREIGLAQQALLADLDTCLLLVPCELRATAAAAQVAARLLPHCADVRLVTRGPAPAALQPADVERVVGLPLALAMRAHTGLAALLERGDPPGRGGLTTGSRALLDLLLPQHRAA